MRRGRSGWRLVDGDSTRNPQEVRAEGSSDRPSAVFVTGIDQKGRTTVQVFPTPQSARDYLVARTQTLLADVGGKSAVAVGRSSVDTAGDKRYAARKSE